MRSWRAPTLEQELSISYRSPKHLSFNGDVFDGPALRGLQLTQSLGSLLSSSSTKLHVPEQLKSDPTVNTRESPYCKCSVCYNVFLSGEIQTSKTFGVADYKICDRTNRLYDVSRLQEGQCWKCRCRCWQNYSLSHAWMKKKKVIPKYKRKLHQQLIKLPEVNEQKANDINSFSVDFTSTIKFDDQRMGRKLVDSQILQPLVIKEHFKLPPINTSREKLAQNMLPQTVVAKVMGGVPSLNFHYNEKTDVQMRWLLVKASMRRLIKMDNEKKMQVKESFTAIARNIKLMEKQQEEEKHRRIEMETRMKLDQTKESVVRKIRLSKFKNSMQKVLKDGRDRKAKEEQLSEARRELLTHKLSTFKHESESFQKALSGYLFPRTAILLQSKRGDLRKQLFEPENRLGGVCRSQSSVCVHDQYVDSLWMEPQIDAFLTDIGLLNELIMNRMRTDFLDHVSYAFIRPQKHPRSKSCPCPLRQGASYRYIVPKRHDIEGQSKTVESIDWGSKKMVFLNPAKVISQETGLNNLDVDNDTNIDVIYNSFLYMQKLGQSDYKTSRKIKLTKLAVKSSRTTKNLSLSREHERASSAPTVSKKLQSFSRIQSKVAHRSIVLDLRNLKSYDSLNVPRNERTVKLRTIDKSEVVNNSEKLNKTGLKKFKRDYLTISKAKQLANESNKTGRIANTEQKLSEEKPSGSSINLQYKKKTTWSKIKTAVKEKSMLDAQQKPITRKMSINRRSSLMIRIVNEMPEPQIPVLIDERPSNTDTGV